MSSGKNCEVCNVDKIENRNLINRKSILENNGHNTRYWISIVISTILIITGILLNLLVWI